MDMQLFKSYIHFMSLGSGSSGNCYCLATDTSRILIDAGIGIRVIKKRFRENGLKMGNIQAVFITHDHGDHIKAVGHLATDEHIPIYATSKTFSGMNRNKYMKKELDSSHIRIINKEEPLQLGDFRITCFEVPHDGTDNVGYSIDVNDKNFAFLTDLGHISEKAAHYISLADYLVLESNYDETMLRTGSYPELLKQRIAGTNGHMCNRDTAEYIANHFPKKLKYLWLCHLSKDNNRPELAYHTMETALKEKNIQIGKDLYVIPLERTTPSKMYLLE